MVKQMGEHKFPCRRILKMYLDNNHSNMDK